VLYPALGRVLIPYSGASQLVTPGRFVAPHDFIWDNELPFDFERRRVSIVVKPVADSFEYRFDPTRPESRTARLLVDDVLQRGKGRTDVARVGEEQVTEPGARYIDFLRTNQNGYENVTAQTVRAIAEVYFTPDKFWQFEVLPGNSTTH